MVFTTIISKITITSISALTLIFCFTTAAQNPVPKLKDRSKAGILTYLKKITENNQIIVGQQCTETSDVAADYKKYFQSLYDSTGKYPALLGLDYGFFGNVDLVTTNQYLINHWKKGGLVTICWHADNPFRDGYKSGWNAITNKDSINLKSLLKNAPESKEKNNYRTELYNVAKALQKLQKAGVTVLWRPFHEMNGPWFWWGVNDLKNPTNKQDYVALWQDMYQTFTNDFKLTNLLWVYSPNAGSQWVAPINAMYPGDESVDLVGVDRYSIAPDFKDFNDLKAFNKQIVNGEVGAAKEGYGKYDQLLLLNELKGKAAYFLQWHSWNNAKVAIVDNVNYKKMMNDPAAITLDKIK